jgi:hypothetical protein
MEIIWFLFSFSIPCRFYWFSLQFVFQFFFLYPFLIFLLVCPFAQDIYFTSDEKNRATYHLLPSKNSQTPPQWNNILKERFISNIFTFYHSVHPLLLLIFCCHCLFVFFFFPLFSFSLKTHNFLYHLFYSKETVMLSPFVFNLSLC